MHELAYADEIVRIVRANVEPEQLSRVRTIHLRIGDVTAIQEDCLRFALEAITADTELAGATVAVERVKTLLRCNGCGKEFEPEEAFLSPCPGCGGFDTKLLAGDEMSVQSVDLE